VGHGPDALTKMYRKWITVYENRMCPAMCPVIHFTAIAFADNAFHPRLIDAGLTVRTMHSFRCPDGQTTIRFALRDDILDTPIFRRSRQTMEGVAVDPVRAMSGTALSYGTRRLGQNAGFEQSFYPYCIRREVGTELTGPSWISSLEPLIRRARLADCLDRSWCQ